MGKTLAILVLAFFVCAVSAASKFGAETAREAPLLREGFVLKGVDGKLVGPDSNDVWFFEFSSDVNDYRAVVKAGTRLELLPSSALEKMTADAEMRSAVTYRLWDGRVTKYKGRNFIFPNYFLPLSKAKKPESKTSQEPQQKQRESTETPPGQERKRGPALDDPNDVLAIPQEIMEKLKARRERIADSGQRIADSNRVPVDELQLTSEKGKFLNAKRYTQSADSILADRTAFLVGQGDGRLVFVPDALGRNVQQASLRLLPCQALELTEQKQSAEPEPARFKIAGIMTKYKGKDYLLLQRATQAYSHGNFGR
ncbi:MAG: hypothetical protein ACYSYV_10080 [Planctomycetota bacterium]|jgi:hypothetical protein